MHSIRAAKIKKLNRTNRKGNVLCALLSYASKMKQVWSNETLRKRSCKHARSLLRSFQRFHHCRIQKQSQRSFCFLLLLLLHPFVLAQPRKSFSTTLLVCRVDPLKLWSFLFLKKTPSFQAPSLREGQSSTAPSLIQRPKVKDHSRINSNALIDSTNHLFKVEKMPKMKNSTKALD